MKKTFFLLLGLSLLSSAYAQKTSTNGIFFEISGKGLKSPSYILGSNHEVTGSFVHQIPQFDIIYNKVKQTCFETELNDDVETSDTANKKAVASVQQQQQMDANMLLLPADSTYAKIIGEKRAAEIDSIMTSHFPSFVSNMRPFYASAILKYVLQARQLGLTGLEQTPFQSIDYYVHSLSKRDNKSIQWLEPRAYQDSLVARMNRASLSDNPSLYDQMMVFYQMCKTLNMRIDASGKAKALYMRGLGMSSIEQMLKSSEEVSAVNNAIMPGKKTVSSDELMAVKERNTLWMKKIPELMKQEPTLFVVGVAHLLPYRGSKGLIADLKKKGYKVRQLDGPEVQLAIKACNKEMTKQMFVFKFANGDGDRQQLTMLNFDDDLLSTYSGVTSDNYNLARIFVGNEEFSCFLKKNRRLNATFTKNGDKYTVDYSGDSDLVQASKTMNKHRSSFSLTNYFARTDTDPAAKTTYEEKLALLDRNIVELNHEAEKVQDADIRNMLLMDNRCEFLRFRLNVMRSEMKKKNVDIATDPEYQKYLNMIDVDNPYYERFNLITDYVNGKIPQSVRDAGLSSYGVAAMRAIQDNVKDRATRLQLMGNIAQQVLTEENKDIDTFWDAFKEFGDKDVVNALQQKVLALKNTKSGMDAPICEFNDAEGNTHSSSDYKGKVLYIDFWATWCGPCKQEIPHMAKLYEHFKDNDKIAIISISIDTNVAAWKKMIANDKPAWPQFVAEGAQNVKLSSDWGITAIPRFIVLDANGKIRSANAMRPSQEGIIDYLDSIIAEQQ